MVNRAVKIGFISAAILFSIQYSTIEVFAGDNDSSDESSNRCDENRGCVEPEISIEQDNNCAVESENNINDDYGINTRGNNIGYIDTCENSAVVNGYSGNDALISSICETGCLSRSQVDYFVGNGDGGNGGNGNGGNGNDNGNGGNGNDNGGESNTGLTSGNSDGDSGNSGATSGNSDGDSGGNDGDSGNSGNCQNGCNVLGGP